MQAYRSSVSIHPQLTFPWCQPVECLAGHHYKGIVFEFEAVTKFQKIAGILEGIAKLPDGERCVATLKTELLKAERFLRNKFVRFIEEHLPDEFWKIPDKLYQFTSGFREITRENLAPCLRRIYDARSSYVHGGSPFPLYVEVSLRDRVPAEVISEVMALRGQDRYLPPFFWFEYVAHLTIVEYMRRSFGPDLARVQQERLTEKKHLLGVMSRLPQAAQDSLKRIAQSTVRFLGFAMINPRIPNREWADSAETVQILLNSGLIGTEGEGLESSSWLKNRDVGEAVGEFVFGARDNPLRDNELLLPKDWEHLFDEATPGESPDRA